MKSFFIFLLAYIAAQNSSNFISNINILLPLTREKQVVYEIEAYNGCFTWTSSAPNIISVKGIVEGDSCSAKALLKLETTEEQERIVWITATDKNNGHKLTCEAKVAKIQRIQILTKKKTVLVDDLETLELQAYDAKGNVFSSLEGINFIWSIKQQKANAEFLNLKKALKKTSQVRYDIEQRNFQSDIVILKGLENGVILVNAKVHDELYTDVHTQDTLYIIENFLISPLNDVQMLPCSHLQFDLYKIKVFDNTQKFDKITLPNSQFQWIIDQENFGQMLQSGKFISSKQLGQTQLTVMDSTNKENKISTKINIVEPQSIEMQINPFDNDLYEHLKYKQMSNFELQKKFERFENNWNLVQGRKYIIRVDLVDEKGRNVSTEGLKFNFSFSKQGVSLHEQFENVLIISTIDLALSDQIIVEFPPQKCFENSLITSKSFSVHSQVSIFKLQERIYLPYQEGKIQQQIYEFSALGGSKQYEWVSSSSSIGFVNSQGVFEGKTVGNTTVKCFDKNNNSNYDEIEVVVEKVKEINFSDIKKELLLNDQDQLYVTALGQSNNIFANCTSLDFSISQNEDLNSAISNDSYLTFISKIKAFHQKRKYSYIDDLYAFKESKYEFYLINGIISETDFQNIVNFHQNYGYCKAMLLNPRQQGLFEIQLEADNQNKKIPVMVFKKPKLVFPDGYDERIYGKKATIAPGSSISFIIQDGVRPLNKTGRLQNRVFYQNQDNFDVQVQEIDQNSTKVIVNCLKPHQSPQEFQIQSFSSEDLKQPLITIVDFVINCQDPSFIAISPVQYIKNQPENLMKLPKAHFDLENDHKHNLSLNGFNDQNIPFWNITSIVAEWKVNSDLANIVQSSNNEVEVKLNDKFGEFHLTASSNHYKDKRKFPSVVNTIRINQFKPLKIQEESTLILNHPENKQIFHLNNGSGNFLFSLEDPSLANVHYDQTKRIIELTPKKEGETTLIIKDLNLESQNDVKHTIKIGLVDQIVLNVDENIKVRGSIFNPSIIFMSNKQEIPKNQQKFIDYEIQIPSKSSDVSIDDQYQIYIGKQGKYNMNVFLQDSNLYSNTVEITVFDYITAFPQEIHSIKECKSLLKIIGGPDVNQLTSKEFKISIYQDNPNLKIQKIKENIYEISSTKSGQYEIQIGLWQKEQQVSHSKASIVIGDITGVYLNIPEVIYNGTTVRGYAIPQIDSHLMSPGSCEMEFDIENLSPQNLDVQKKHHFRNLVDQNFSIAGFDIKAIETGLGNLKVSLKKKNLEVTYSEQQISIKDRDMLQTAHFMNSDKNCKNCSSFILMKPNSSMQIKTQKMLEIDPQQNCRVDNSVIQCGNKVGNQILIENSDNGFINAAVLSVQNPQSLVVQNADQQQLQTESIKLELQILYLNKQGYVFQNDYSQNEFQFLVSNNEVLNAYINENKLIINTLKQGFSYVYIQSLVYPHLFDIFEINVGKFVSPTGTINLHVGDEATFENLLNKTFSDWNISNNVLASITQNGKFKSLKEGKVDVLIGQGGVTVAQVQNHIITQLKPIQENPSIITNIVTHHHFKKQYEVLFEGFENNQKVSLFSNEKVNNSLKVDCTSSLKFIITSPIIEREKGIFGCSIIFDRKQEINESSGSIKIVLKSLKEDKFFVESRYNFQVITLFQFQKNVSTIYLNKSQRSHQLKIKTNHALNVSTKNDKNLSLESKFDGSKSLQTIIVNAKGDQDFEDVLVIKSDFNQQTQEIKIYFKKQKSWFGINFSISSWLDWIMLITFIWVIFYFLNYYYKKTEENQPQFMKQYPINSTNISNISGIYGVNKQEASNIYPRREMHNSLYDSGIHRRNQGLFQ